MKTLTVIGLVALAFGFVTSTFAGDTAGNESYCLESSNGRLRNGAGTYLDCNAEKNGPLAASFSGRRAKFGLCPAPIRA